MTSSASACSTASWATTSSPSRKRSGGAGALRRPQGPERNQPTLQRARAPSVGDAEKSELRRRSNHKRRLRRQRTRQQKRAQQQRPPERPATGSPATAEHQPAQPRTGGRTANGRDGAWSQPQHNATDRQRAPAPGTATGAEYVDAHNGGTTQADIASAAADVESASETSRGATARPIEPAVENLSLIHI